MEGTRPGVRTPGRAGRTARGKEVAETATSTDDGPGRPRMEGPARGDEWKPDDVGDRRGKSHRTPPWKGRER